jgi:plastocyanin
MLAHQSHGLRAREVVLLVLTSFTAMAVAASVTVRVSAADSGEPLEDVVVMVNTAAPVVYREGARTTAMIEQRNQQFQPGLLVIRPGTAVSFPNRDDTRHHVYSFSSAKTFEIRLYHGLPAEPIVFDRTGPVALGCNIHDQMRAFIYVTDADRWGTTNAAGRTELSIPASDLPVELAFWHSRLRGGTVTRVIEGPVPETLAQRLDVRPPLPQHRAPETNLQQRFDLLVQ